LIGWSFPVGIEMKEPDWLEILKFGQWSNGIGETIPGCTMKHPNWLDITR
jgi:hypothetical protein